MQNILYNILIVNFLVIIWQYIYTVANLQEYLTYLQIKTSFSIEFLSIYVLFLKKLVILVGFLAFCDLTEDKLFSHLSLAREKQLFF